MNEVINQILSKLNGVTRNADGSYRACCPAHDDQHPSLGIRIGPNGKVQLTCFAGCARKAIWEALGMNPNKPTGKSPDNSIPRGRIVAEYPYHDEDGKLLYRVVRFFPKSFRQCRPDGKGGWIWNMEGTRRVLYRLPELLEADYTEWAFVCEGEKDVDNFRAKGAIATTCPGGACKWDKLSDDSALDARLVAILVDKDEIGEKHGQQVARCLNGRVADVRIVRLPGAGKDVTDWFDAGGTLDELIKLADLAESYDPDFGGSLPDDGDDDDEWEDDVPTIVLDANEPFAITKAIDALSADSNLFTRGGLLVRTTPQWSPINGTVKRDETWEIQPLPHASLRERIAQHARLIRYGKDGEERHVNPPSWLVSGIESRGTWNGIRPLAAISDSPILRADGSIVQTPGYDDATSVIFKPWGLAFPEVAQDIDQDRARRACDLLLEVVTDFPFEREYHRSAFLAALLTLLARNAFPGPSPFFMIDSNVRGAGKSKLAQLIGRIALGREMPVSTYSHDCEELRKRLTAMAISGDRAILFDNIDGQFGNAVIDQALTSTSWSDRLLGRSVRIQVPFNPLWIGTGNNVSVKGDTVRRVIHIRLECMVEHPELRSGFRHTNLIGWVDQHRGELLSAALTILSGFLRAGAPILDSTPFGSFEGWSSVVRGAVLWVGLPDPCLSRETIVESLDSDVECLRAFIEVCPLFDPTNEGIVIADQIRRLYPREAPVDPQRESMRRALEGFAPPSAGQVPNSRRIGRRLLKLRRRVVNGHFIAKVEDKYNKSGAVWRLHRVGSSS